MLCLATIVVGEAIFESEYVMTDTWRPGDRYEAEVWGDTTEGARFSPLRTLDDIQAELREEKNRWFWRRWRRKVGEVLRYRRNRHT
jgi:hypothetical protein